MSYEASNYLSKYLIDDIGTSNCLVINPISTGNEDLDDSCEPIGYIIVLQTSQSLREEEVLLIETMSNSISPIVDHLQAIKLIKQEHIINQKEVFLNSLNAKLVNRDKYFIDFYIYYKKLIQIPFEQLDLSCYSKYEHYFFDNLLIILSYDQIEDDHFDECTEVSSVEDAINKLKDAYIQNL
jgi:hypothetical protein